MESFLKIKTFKSLKEVLESFFNIKNFKSLRRWCSISSNINEAIWAVSNFFLFFCEKISHAQKSTKKHQKAQKRNQAKAQSANKRTTIKNALKKHLRGKKYLFAYLLFRAREEKKIENKKMKSLYNVMH